MQLSVILAALSVLAIAPARADTVVFRTGEQLRGTVVAERVPLVVSPNPANARYLATKAARLSHSLDD